MDNCSPRGNSLCLSISPSLSLSLSHFVSLSLIHLFYLPFLIPRISPLSFHRPSFMSHTFISYGQSYHANFLPPKIGQRRRTSKLNNDGLASFGHLIWNVSPWVPISFTRWDAFENSTEISTIKFYNLWDLTDHSKEQRRCLTPCLCRLSKLAFGNVYDESYGGGQKKKKTCLLEESWSTTQEVLYSRINILTRQGIGVVFYNFR